MNKPICLLKAGTKLLDRDPKYLIHEDTVRRIKARFQLLKEREKGRVA